MTVEAPQPVRYRTPRWMIVVLVISLAGNLLVIGGAIGAMWHFKRNHTYRAAGMPPYFGAFVARLPNEKREKIKAILRSQRARIEPLRAAFHRAHEAAISEIDANPLDMEKLKSLYRTYNEARSKLREARAEFIPQILGLLSPEERKDLVRMRKRGRRWHHHRPPPDER
jgi:uncharacterized membrane protein